MASIHQWLAASASQTEDQQQPQQQQQYNPTQTDVTNAAAAVAQAAMMARQQAEADRARRRARRERDERSGSESPRSDYGDRRHEEQQPTNYESMAARAAYYINQQHGFQTGTNFQFDPTTGYYCDNYSGCYFDPNTKVCLLLLLF